MDPYRIYLGGALFSHKELLGNAMLAAALGRLSSGELSCALPQCVEPRDSSPVAIRDSDLKSLMECDGAIFCFDGAELDSGTVAEFLFAKSIDMPCLLLRTDFRSAGDQGEGQEPWNLMCSFFPRAGALRIDSMACYKSCLADCCGDPCKASLALCESIAGKALPQMLSLLHSEPLQKPDGMDAMTLLRWASRFPGPSFERLCSEDASFLPALFERKKARRLL